MNPRFALASLAVFAFCSKPGFADLTLSGYSVIGSFGMPVSGQEQIMIHKTSVRRDLIDRGRAYTHLFDLDKHQAVIIDHLFRRAEVYDLNAMQANAEVNAPVSGLKLEIERMDGKHTLRNWTCREYNLTASIPARMGNEETVFQLKGQIWLAQGVREQAEVKSLVKMAKSPDFFLAIPDVARMMPAQAKAMSEVMRKLAPKGLPCEGEVEFSYEGNGPMANLARKMPTKLGFTFQNYSTDPIAQDAFAIPAGYQVMQGRRP
jgi:hypothetical protein